MMQSHIERDPIDFRSAVSRMPSARLRDDTGLDLSYQDFDHLVDQVACRLSGPRSLILLVAKNDIHGLACLLGAWRAGHCVFPISSDVAKQNLEALIASYRPAWLVAHDEMPLADEELAFDLAGGYRRLPAFNEPVQPYSDLCLLLSTSGSIGAPKAVKLTHANLYASTLQTIVTLSVAPHECLGLALPICHIYGLNLALAHLRASAGLALTGRSVLDPRQHEFFRISAVSTLPGVNFTFDFFRRIGWKRVALPSITKLTHSGDRLEIINCEWASQITETYGVLVYKMYGMTEAAGRLSVLAPIDFATHSDTVGKAVPGGSIIIRDGEVVYSGDNVMSGYSISHFDLEIEARLSELRTGDLGEITPDGYLRLTGRRSRIAKLMGRRISLDELEAALAPLSPAIASTSDNGIRLRLEIADSDEARRQLYIILRKIRVPRGLIVAEFGQALPRSASGKVRSGVDVHSQL